MALCTLSPSNQKQSPEVELAVSPVVELVETPVFELAETPVY